MRRVLGAVLWFLALVLLCAPLSVVATIALMHFWSWLEAATGIESIGHSGPAEWCYAAVFVLMLAAGIGSTLALRAHGGDNAEERS